MHTSSLVRNIARGKHGAHGHLARRLYYKFYHRFPYGFPQIAFPSTIELELTNDCNMRCPHCPRSIMTRGVGYMEFATFKKIADEIADHSNCFLRIGGLGEPSLHPDIKAILRYAKDLGIILEIVTNGQLLAVLTPEEVVGSGLRYLGISIDGFDAMTYAKRRPGGDYGSLQDRVAALWRHKQETKSPWPHIKIRHVVYPNDSPEQIEAYRQRWFAYADMVGFNKYTPTGTKAFTPPYRSCRFIKWEIKVNWNGETPLCRFQNNIRDEEIVGDASEQTIAEIWTNARMQEARRAHAEGHLRTMEYCKACQKVQDPGDKTVWK